MRVLIYACTYYQRIISVLIAQDPQFKDADIDLVCLQTSQTMYNEEEIERLSKSQVFRKVHFISPDKRHPFVRKIFSFRDILSIASRPLYFDQVDIDEPYDYVLLYNMDKYSVPLLAYLVRKNPNIIYRRFEEGLISYTGNYLSRSAKILVCVGKLLARIRKQPWLDEVYDGCYYLEPEHVIIDTGKPFLPLCKINVNNQVLVAKLNYIFGYQPIRIEEQYIFFEDCYANDGHRINDIELLESVARIVGKENIIVKLHPRSKKDRFSSRGYKTMDALSVPWEIIQMNQDQSNKVLISVASGTLISVLHLFKQNSLVVLLHHLMDADEYVTSVAINDNFEVFLKRFQNATIMIPDSLDEIKEIASGRKAQKSSR